MTGDERKTWALAKNRGVGGSGPGTGEEDADATKTTNHNTPNTRTLPRAA